MDTTKVIIENWPQTNYLLEYIPTIIAIIALATSLYSVYLTRKSFIASHRPYVWSSSYGVIDQAKKTIIPIPFRVAYRIINAPAKIIWSEVEIKLNNKQLFVYSEKNFVRFPDNTSEWNFSIGQDDFKKIMNQSEENKSKLVRIISLKYTFLGSGKTYYYELQQSFSLADNQWIDTNSTAN